MTDYVSVMRPGPTIRPKPHGLLSAMADEPIPGTSITPAGLLGMIPFAPAQLAGGLLSSAPYLAGEKPMEAGLMNISQAIPYLLPNNVAKIVNPVMMAIGQAKKGGEIGKNKEFYKGGQFLPGSESTEKGALKIPKGQRAGGKSEVEPGTWAPRPQDGMIPVSKQFEFDWAHFRATGELRPYAGFTDYARNPSLLSEAKAAADAFNSGARWTKDGAFFDIDGNPLGLLGR